MAGFLSGTLYTEALIREAQDIFSEKELLKASLQETEVDRPGNSFSEKI